MIELLPNIFTTDLVLAFMIVILAGIARGFTGFVSGLVNVGLLALLYGPVEAIVLSSLFGFASSVMLLRKTIKLIRWSEVVPLNLAAAISIPITTAALLQADSSLVKPAIGLFIAACGITLMLGWNYEGPRNGYVAGLTGALCGSVQGFTGAGGPLMVFYFLASPDSVPTQRANISVTVFIITLMMILALIWGQVIDARIILLATILFPGTVIGTWLGIRLFEIASEEIYKKLAYMALITIGIVVALA